MLITTAFSRNPCCSGPTPSTSHWWELEVGLRDVAIPVVVDLLLRRGIKKISTGGPGVAIPVVVDLLLRHMLNYTILENLKKSQSLL